MPDIRPLLDRAGLTQTGAARLLRVSDRTMRYWCADGAPLAACIALAAVNELSARTGETPAVIIARLANHPPDSTPAPYRANS